MSYLFIIAKLCMDIYACYDYKWQNIFQIIKLFFLKYIAILDNQYNVSHTHTMPGWLNY